MMSGSLDSSGSLSNLVQFHSSPGRHLVIWQQLAPPLEASDRTQKANWRVYLNNLLNKIQSASCLCAKLARAERLLKSHLFLLCRWHWHTKVVGLFLRSGEHPLNLFESGADVTRAWRKGHMMGTEITTRPVEACSTNKCRKRRLRFRDEGESAWWCYPVAMPRGRWAVWFLSQCFTATSTGRRMSDSVSIHCACPRVGISRHLRDTFLLILVKATTYKVFI